MMEQITLESLLVEVQSKKQPRHSMTCGADGFSEHMNPPEPPCYSCRHALKRGTFRICMTGGRGYLRAGDTPDCDLYEEAKDE